MASMLSGMGACSALSYCGSAACCFGSAAISCCSNRCSSTNSTVTRVAYAVILLLTTIAAWLMLSDPLEKELAQDGKGRFGTGLPDACKSTLLNYTESGCRATWGALGVYRVMFASSMFFGLMACIMMGVTDSRDKRAGIQNGFWGPKLLLITGLSVAAFFIKNDFFLKAWGWIALFGGFMFLLVQLVLLIDFAHAWADAWVGKIEEGPDGEEGSKCHKWLIVLSSLGMYAVSITATVLMFVFYTKSDDSGCSDNKFFISFNLILCIIITFVGVSDRVQQVMPNSGLLQAGVVVSYCTYLTWSAISETHAENGACMPGSMTANDSSTTVIGAMFTFVAVAYASLRTSSASMIGSVGMNDGENAEKSKLIDDNDDDDDDLETGNGSGSTRRGGTQDDEKGAVLYNWCFFHVSFMFASMYMMMVLTDWGVMSDRNSHPDFHVGRGKASTWVKIVSAWLSALLYIWSLIAPICLPDRDFSGK